MSSDCPDSEKIEDEDTGTQNNSKELDALLEDALGDFSKPFTPKKSLEHSSEKDVNKNVALTEEFIQQATKNFELAMRAMVNKESDLNSPGSGDLESCTTESMSDVASEVGKVAGLAAASQASRPPTLNSDEDFTKCIGDVLKQVSQNSQDVQATPTADDLSKMFAGFGLGSEAGDGNMANGFFPLMQTMLENILSKDVLYEPIREITEKYPDWLANNKDKIAADEFDRYNKQYDIMKQVKDIFENDANSGVNLSEEDKAHHFDEVLKLMQKLQELGQPPAEIAGDCGPMINFDPEGNPVTPDITTLFGGPGFAEGSAPDSGGKLPTEDQCNLM